VIRSKRPRLHDIATNIEVVFDITKGRTCNHLQGDTALRYVVLHALMIIAEAVKNLPAETLARYPHISWKAIVGVGTLIKHEYHRIDPDVIWSVVKVHLPALKPVIKMMLADTDLPGLPL
jgi:uncharacterized protein with HEPN domain